MIDHVARLRTAAVLVELHQDLAGTSGVCEDAAAEIERLRAALESIAKNTCCNKCQEAALVAKSALNQQIAEKPIRVQCKCGWVGNQNDLVSIPGGKSCPECDAIFHAFPKHEKA